MLDLDRISLARKRLVLSNTLYSITTYLKLTNEQTTCLDTRFQFLDERDFSFATGTRNEIYATSHSRKH